MKVIDRHSTALLIVSLTENKIRGFFLFNFEVEVEGLRIINILANKY